MLLSLCRIANVPTNRPLSCTDLQAFEETFKLRIAVIAASLGNKFIRVPDNTHEDWPLIYLYLVNHKRVSHFHSIVNITGFFSASYFCERCLKPYNTSLDHSCESTCLTCKGTSCYETETTKTCDSCNMVCRSIECFERHLIKKTAKKGKGNDVALSQCDIYWRCPNCKAVVNRAKRSEQDHDCAEWLCNCCKFWVTGKYRCYLFPEEAKKPCSKFIFFDFEATQDTTAQCTKGYSPKKCCKVPCDECIKCQRCSNT